MWGGAGHLLHGIFCTFSWIALSFLDTKRGMTEATAGHVRGGLKRHKKKKKRKGGRCRRSQRRGRPCRNTLGSNCTSYFLRFLFLTKLVTHSSTSPHPSTAVDGPTFTLAQHFLLSHCALPHLSAHAGRATNECSW